MRLWLATVIAFGGALSLVAPSFVVAQPLPTRVYSTADGLAHDRVKRVVADSRGLLWFCTPDGLSRFDGTRFTTYKQAQGLPFDSVNDLIETRTGDYWLATNGGGVARVAEDASFVTFAVGGTAATNRVNVLYEDTAGRIWAGTDSGLLVLDPSQTSFRQVPLAGSLALSFEPQVWAIARTDTHGLLVGTGGGLVARSSENQLRAITVAGRQNRSVSALITAGGWVWIGHTEGIATLAPSVTIAEPVATSASVLALTHRDDRVWAGTIDGDLLTFDAGTRAMAERHSSLVRSGILSLAVDRVNGLWIGSRAEGSLRLQNTALVPFAEREGLPPLPVRVITESRQGDIYVVSLRGTRPLFVLDGPRFVEVTTPDVAGAVPRVVHQDRRGHWWMGSAAGLAHFAASPTIAALRSAAPLATYTTRNGLPHGNVLALFEDSAARMWIGTGASAHVTYVDGRDGMLHDIATARLGLPALQPNAFAEDRATNIWIGGRNGEIGRYRRGTIEPIATPWPLRQIAGMLIDQAGRLWVASAEGLFRIDAPAAERPTLTEVGGLTSRMTRFVVEDPFGRLYVGLPSGVNRLDPNTGVVELYTPADGLRGSELTTSLRDGTGHLWFGTHSGVTRLAPSPETVPVPASRAYISAVRIAGAAGPPNLRGASGVGPIALDWTQNHIAIDYFGVTYRAGESAAFRYRLEGADTAWSTPTSATTIAYPNLPPGRYRFVVEVVAPAGADTAQLATSPPATVTFTILAPLWQRWWFLTLAGLGLCVAGWTGYRYRLAQLLEVERLRTRIATDLHDDIGASLSRITVLSEVAQRRLAAHPEERQMLSSIADASRGMIDAMSDIVWTISPDRDSVHDLTQRMREFASDQLAARGIDFTFDTPPVSVQRALGLSVRRELLLIFKEAITNSARHSGATAVKSTLSLDGKTLQLEVLDNGDGFPPDSTLEGDGNGLGNMARRAQALGGRLIVDSGPGRGTSIVVTAPLGARPLPGGALRR